MTYLKKQGCMVISFIIESCPCLSIKREFRRAEGRSKLSVIMVPNNPIKQVPIAKNVLLVKIEGPGAVVKGVNLQTPLEKSTNQCKKHIYVPLSNQSPLV
jgi:hypothetical protein